MAQPKSCKTKIPKPEMPGAVMTSIRAALSPQLATLTNTVPNAGEWLYEIKLDGYRLMTRFETGKPALITRRGNDWSAKMPVLLRELADLDVPFFEGYDLRQATLRDRRRFLEAFLHERTTDL